MHDITKSVVFSALLVISSVAGAVVVSGQGTVHQETYTDGPDLIIIDQSDMNGKFEVSVLTPGVENTGDSQSLILRKTVGQGAEQKLVFRNKGAYDNLTVQVRPLDGTTGQPTFNSADGGVDNVASVGFNIAYFLGHTGGDADMQCDDSDQLMQVTVPFTDVIDCNEPPDNTVDTSQTDAQQTKLDLYMAAQNQNASRVNYQDTMDNYLQDTETQALIIGKNAYIRALNNGTSKSAAKTKAKQAVEDYYAVKQVNLANEYKRAVHAGRYWESVTSNESDIQTRYVHWARYNPAGSYNDAGDENHVYSYDVGNTSVTLLNNTAMTVPKVGFRTYDSSGGRTNHIQREALTKTPRMNDAADNNVYFYGFGVDGYDSDASPVEVWNSQRSASQWTEINQQAESVKSQIDTVVENTYSQYQAGEINNSDLVDPYVLATEHSPGDEFQGWAAAQLTLMGTNSPETFDKLGHMKISTESGQTYKGVLFSQENPQSGQFEVNQTYNPAEINGTQYVVTSDRMQELTENFTVEEMQSTDGEEVKNVTIEKTTYKTTNVTELKEMYEDLAYQRAQIEAREQSIATGGGLVSGSSSNLLLIAAAVGAVFVLSQRGNGGGRRGRRR